MHSVVIKNFEGTRYFLHKDGQLCECICEERLWKNKPTLKDIENLYGDMMEFVLEIVVLSYSPEYSEDVLYQVNK